MVHVLVHKLPMADVAPFNIGRCLSPAFSSSFALMGALFSGCIWSQHGPQVSNPHATSLFAPTLQGKYIVPKYSKSALAGDWVLMWQDTGAVFRLHLGEDLQFESVEGVGSGQLGGRWNLWGADRFVVCVFSRF